MKWNKLTSSKLRKGQSLVIYVPVVTFKPTPLLEPLPLIVATPETTVVRVEPDWKPIALPDTGSKKKTTKSRRSKRKSLHKISRGESLFTIAAQYQGVTVNDLIEWNNLQPGEPLEPGKKIKIKKK